MAACLCQAGACGVGVREAGWWMRHSRSVVSSWMLGMVKVRAGDGSIVGDGSDWLCCEMDLGRLPPPEVVSAGLGGS